MVKKNATDFTVIASVAGLVAIGIIMVFSSSYTYTLVHYGDGLHYLKLMVRWAILGSFVMFITSNIKYVVWKRWAPLILIMSIVFLLLLLYTPLGITAKGATRWLRLGPIQFMPSEVAKMGLIIFLSASIEKRQHRIQKLITGQLPYLLLAGIFFLLLREQPDFSTAIVMMIIIGSLLFVGGMKFSHFFLVVSAGVGSLAYMSYHVLITGTITNYRAQRLISFVDPWEYAQGDGYQVIQSLYALGSGGVTGQGLGQSVQKHLYLPEPQNDFIFSIIGEELGYVGGLIVIMLFLLLIWKGIKIAMNAPDLFSSLMATGIVAMIGSQAIINIAVATSSMPVTGMPLPFVSYGGTSLLILMGAAGILVNISKYCNFEIKEGEAS